MNKIFEKPLKYLKTILKMGPFILIMFLQRILSMILVFIFEEFKI